MNNFKNTESNRLKKMSSLKINSETTCFNLAFYRLVTNISFKRRQKLQLYSQKYLINWIKSLGLTPVFLFLYLLKKQL